VGWLCNRCGKAQAVFHLTDIQHPSGEKVERHLCEQCAAEAGFMLLEKPPTASEQIEKFMTAAQKGQLSGLAGLVCPECGVSYLEFRNQGLLGCPNDYDAFREALLPLLERAHEGGTHHVGKTPASMGVQRTTEQDIQRLKRLLDEAVGAEDYERAAELRDRIRTLEDA
jgi:protein arginine kinase activator